MSSNLTLLAKPTFSEGFTKAFAFGPNYGLTILGYVPLFGTIAAVIRIAYAFFNNPGFFKNSDYKGFLAGTILRSILEIATGPALAIGHLFAYCIWKPTPSSQESNINPQKGIPRSKPSSKNQIYPNVPIKPQVVYGPSMDDEAFETQETKLEENPEMFFNLDAKTMSRDQYLESACIAFPALHPENSINFFKKLGKEAKISKELYGDLCETLIIKRTNFKLFKHVNPHKMLEKAYFNLSYKCILENFSTNCFKDVDPKKMTPKEYFILSRDLLEIAPRYFKDVEKGEVKDSDYALLAEIAIKTMDYNIQYFDINKLTNEKYYELLKKAISANSPNIKFIKQKGLDDEDYLELIENLINKGVNFYFLTLLPVEDVKPNLYVELIKIISNSKNPLSSWLIKELDKKFNKKSLSEQQKIEIQTCLKK